MRRVVLAVGVCLGVQLICPAPAQAWWGWWDELSGAGPFRGWEIEARLVCFGEATSHPARDGTLALMQRQFDYATTEFRTNPNADRELVQSLTALNALLDAAVSNSVTVADLSEIGTRASDLRTRSKGRVDQRVQDAFTDLERRLTESRGRLEILKNQRGSAGVVFSACSIGRDNNRRVSINTTARLLHSYGERKDQYAGGNQIQLAMFVPALAWRPLADFRSFDIVDLSTGGGVYWFSSEAALPGSFESFSGFVLEPVRIDFHFPSSITMKGAGGALLAGLSYRRGWAIFPRGFAANAFGTTTTPPQAHQISAEWVRTAAIFMDVTPFIHYVSTRNK